MAKLTFRKKVFFTLIGIISGYLVMSFVSNTISNALLWQFDRFSKGQKYRIAKDNTFNFSSCEQKFLGKTWWNHTFNQHWVDICRQNAPYLPFPESSMKCSTSNTDKLQMCIARNVYAYPDPHGMLQFALRCNLDNTYWRESDMDDNTPNINSLKDEFHSMNTKQSQNVTYLQSFTPHMNTETVYYFSNNFADSCTTHVESANHYHGNHWRCLSFILQIVGMRLTLDNTVHSNTKSVYITGTKASRLKESGTFNIVHEIISPLFDEILFQPITSHSFKPIRFLPELRVMPSPTRTVIWNFADNVRECSAQSARSPLVNELKNHYMNYYRNKLNDKTLFDTILNANHFSIYYNHSLVKHDQHSLIRFLSNAFYNNTDDIDITYFVSRWSGDQCFQQYGCMNDARNVIEMTVKQMDGIIIHGNSLYLSFVTQLFLHSRIKYYIGMHGPQFALTMFMNQAMDNREYMIFEILPMTVTKEMPTISKNRRNAEKFAKHSGMCYAQMAVHHDGNRDIIDVNPQKLYDAFQKEKDKCAAPTIV